MSLEITHPQKPTPTDKIDDNKYMLPHTVKGVIPDFTSYPGKKAQIPILIEKKTIPADTTTVTFSSLDGDNDKLYYITGEVNIPQPGGVVYLTLQPNSDNIKSNYSGFLVTSGTDMGPTQANLPTGEVGFRLGQTLHASNIVIFNAYLYPITGGKRKIYHTFYLYTDTVIREHNIAETWKNTTDNITSLKILVNTSSFNGEIRLYKMVDINLEELV